MPRDGCSRSLSLASCCGICPNLSGAFGLAASGRSHTGKHALLGHTDHLVLGNVCLVGTFNRTARDRKKCGQCYYALHGYPRCPEPGTREDSGTT
jgi:hypothetical protein